MKRFVALLAVAGLALVAACSDEGPTSPTIASDQVVAGLEGQGFTVMTRNLYVGADLDALMAALATADPSDDQQALFQALQTLEETRIEARIRAVAREIEALRPMVIGLQEVSNIDIDLRELGLEKQIHQNFRELLLARLADRGLHYVMAGHTLNFVATPMPGIRLADHDVILVDADRVHVLKNRDEHVYTSNIGPVAQGVDLRRGMVRVRVETSAGRFTVVSTHLESGSGPGMAELRRAQANELLARLGDAGNVVVVGDLNDVPGSPMYQRFIDRGFRDVWGRLNPESAGYTCCSLANLSNENPMFNQRLDYIFVRGVEGNRTITMFGHERDSRIPGPLHPIWPSDHAGLMLSIGMGIAPVR